jgi:hypothetical protein
MKTALESVRPHTGTVAESLQHGGFRCFCGEWFPDRVHFDEHFGSHPDRPAVCDCCKRVLPTPPLQHKKFVETNIPGTGLIARKQWSVQSK